ncbi:MAG TPA: hypothetical protein EYP65_04815, partial [Armatimonadetes bacterium]|nr:hypothetical protein [Armatimonadota bacterium]
MRRFKVALLLLFLDSLEARTNFVVPSGGKVAVWQAEEAELNGAWDRVRHPWASGGEFVAPKGALSRPLEFIFEVKRPTVIAVRPLWFVHGERRIARRFPHPLPMRHGPDVLDWCGRFVFFTCPSAGRVGILDAITERLARIVDLGGYPVDLVADRRQGRVYIAEAKFDRLLILDARTGEVVGATPLPGCPWSLALHDERLFIACMEAKRMIVFDTVKGKIIAKIPLPAELVHLRVSSQPRPRVMVWFRPFTLDIRTLKPAPSKILYLSPRTRRRCRFGYPQFQPMAYVDSPKPHVLRIHIPHSEGFPPNWRGKKEIGVRTFDVSSVTTPTPQRIKLLKRKGLPIVIGPEAIDGYPIYMDRQSPEVTANTSPVIWRKQHFVFFTAPAAGRIGVFNLDEECLVKSIEIGGYPLDLLVDQKRGKVYIADALGKRLIILDALGHQVVGQIKLRDLPRSMELCAGKLFVTCGKSLVIIDVESRRVVREIKMALRPIAVTLLWEGLANGQVRRVRHLAVGFPAMVFDALTLKFLSEELPPSFSRRKRISVKISKGTKSFVADNLLTLGIDGERWIDVSEAADPQLLSPQPLGEKDAPGTITLSLDNGPEFDWRNDIWFTPDQQIFLIYDTDEFWDWNAITFRLKPGRHILRVRAYSRWAFLDALCVNSTLKGRLNLTVKPLPKNNHWVFYHDEPVRFEVEVRNNERLEFSPRLTYFIFNYLGQEVKRGMKNFVLKPLGIWRTNLKFNLRETGRFTLILSLKSEEGKLVRRVRFVRLPKLVRPRLLFRREEIPSGLAEHLYERSQGNPFFAVELLKSL